MPPKKPTKRQAKKQATKKTKVLKVSRKKAWEEITERS